MHLEGKRIVLELLQKWERSSVVLGESKDTRQSISDAMAGEKTILQKKQNTCSLELLLAFKSLLFMKLLTYELRLECTPDVR